MIQCCPWIMILGGVPFGDRGTAIFLSSAAVPGQYCLTVFFIDSFLT